MTSIQKVLCEFQEVLLEATRIGLGLTVKKLINVCRQNLEGILQ